MVLKMDINGLYSVSICVAIRCGVTGALAQEVSYLLCCSLRLFPEDYMTDPSY